MKEEEINEGNLLIAEFLGSVEINGVCFDLESIKGHEDELEYHSSWNWLMPVVEKIESDIFDGDVSVLIDGDNCHIRYESFNMNVFESSKIKSVYKVVIEFIKFYNENGKGE